jgi:uncharacterized protein YbjT (DUF2867 family)
MSDYKKAVVFGGSGMIGSKVVEYLKAAGLEVVAASRRTGVDTLTGAGLSEVLAGVDIVVDTSDVPKFDVETLQTFFRKSGENIFAAEAKAGVKHHVTLSIVGVDRVRGNPYFDAKLSQEEMVSAGGVPFTIGRATQFFEFMPTIAGGFTNGDVTALPDALFRPVAADDVAKALAEIALAGPKNGAVSITGPEVMSFADWFKRLFARLGDARKAISDATATYFGGVVAEGSIVPEHPEYVGATTFDTWFDTPAAKHALGADRYAHADMAIEKHSAH